VKEFLTQVLTLLEKYLPSFIMAFGLGKVAGQKGLEDANRRAETLEVEKERLENRIRHMDRFHGRSDLDIVNEALAGAGDDPVPETGGDRTDE
jgi:hypothetical protein